MKSDYAYDGAGHITSINHQQRRRTTSSWPAYTPLVAFGYGYDNAGRINAQVTDWNTSLAAFTYRTDEGQAFTYDAAGQLAGVSSNVYGQATYGYTPGGNRSSTTEPGFGTHVYTPGPQNRVAVTDHTGSAIDYSYVYDNEGNVTERRFLSNNALDQRYTWDHRNRLVKVENFDLAGAVAQTIDYRYNAAGDLVYRRDDELGFSEQEHYVVEAGARTMTIEPDGDLKRRYLHGPTDELLFDQAFDGFGNPTLQSQADLFLPLGDHQHSTRVVMGHDGGDAAYVAESIDYGLFGLIVQAYFADGGQPIDTYAPLTVFTHHGSLFDWETGLQLKGARWYSPDLGRFISEDPIQDGSNWYMAFGNNPVMYADPTGLYQAGHPLQGGSRAFDSAIRNLVTNPRPAPIAPTTTFQGFVGAGLGHQVPGGGIGAAPAYTPPPVYNAGNFHGPVSSRDLFTPTLNEIARSNTAASLTRTDRLTPRISTEPTLLRPVPDDVPRARFHDSYSGKPYDYVRYEGREYVLDPDGMNTGLRLNVYETGPDRQYYQAVPSWQSVNYYTEPSSGQLARQAAELYLGAKLPGSRARAATPRTAPLESPTFRQVDDAGIDLVTGRSSVAGGSNATVRRSNLGGDVHHISANTVSPLSRDAGPAIHMDTPHHAQTASFGNSRAARAYREQQRQLVSEGRWRDAIQMDIDDVRSKFGAAYDEAIDQMLRHARSLGLVD